MATNRKPIPPLMAIIIEEGQTPSQDLPENATIFKRPKDLNFMRSEFADQLEQWFSDSASTLVPNLSGEPERLLEKKEYRAAIIAAFSLLEVVIKESLIEKMDSDEILEMDITSNGLINSALRLGFLNQDMIPRIEEWRKKRNLAVHSIKSVKPKEAREAVTGILEVVHVIRDKSGKAV